MRSEISQMQKDKYRMACLPEDSREKTVWEEDAHQWRMGEGTALKGRTQKEHGTQDGNATVNPAFCSGNVCR